MNLFKSLFRCRSLLFEWIDWYKSTDSNDGLWSFRLNPMKREKMTRVDHRQKYRFIATARTINQLESRESEIKSLISFGRQNCVWEIVWKTKNQICFRSSLCDTWHCCLWTQSRSREVCSKHERAHCLIRRNGMFFSTWRSAAWRCGECW